MASLPPFSPTTPQFLKFIPDGSSTYKKLGIPEKFLKKYGEDLLSPIHVRLPSGAEWEFKLTKSNDGAVWLDKGWADFSDFYFLGYGNCLLFRYEGNSRFHVCIFDRSATEIEYPIALPKREENIEEDDDESVEILADFPPCLKTKQKSHLSYRAQKKHRRNNSSSKGGSSTSRMHPLTENEKAIALQRAHDFKSAKPHFKIAIQPSHLMQLMFPCKFAKEHIKQHGGNVKLKVANRGLTYWSVEFKYKKSIARFFNGWSKFVRDNELKVGDVCVFVLMNDIKLSFQVLFYRNPEDANCPTSAKEERSWEIGMSSSHDPCAPRCQIPVPILERSRSYSSDTDTSLGETDGEDNGCVEILDGFRPQVKKTREKYPLPCQQPSKKRKTSPRQPWEVFKESLKNNDSHCPKSETRRETPAPKSENPSFRVVMQPSYVHRGPLNVPAAFTKRYLVEKPVRNIILKVLDGRSWLVEFTYVKPKSRFQRGWSAFSRDNSLKVGDVCDFALIKDDDAQRSFNVSFIRTTEVADCSLSPGLAAMKHVGDQIISKPKLSDRLERLHPLTKTEKALAFHRANAFKSEDPCFSVSIQPAYKYKSYLHLPSEFAKEHLMEQRDSDVILKISDGRSWHVEFKYENKAAHFRQGWSAFVRDNNLEVDDLCAFVLISRNQLIFQVRFYRAIEAEDCRLSPGHGRGAIGQVANKRNPITKVESGCTMNCEIGKHKMVTQRPSSSAPEAASKLTTMQNPFFTAIVGPTSILHVPTEFAKSFIKQKRQIATLWVRDRSWHVNLIGYSEESAAKLSDGWLSFAKDNCLRQGNFCVFELINMSKMVLKVHIFRR